MRRFRLVVGRYTCRKRGKQKGAFSVEAPRPDDTLHYLALPYRVSRSGDLDGAHVDYGVKPGRSVGGESVAFLDHDFAKFIGFVKLEHQPRNVQLGGKRTSFRGPSNVHATFDGESGAATDAGSPRPPRARTGRVSRITGTWTRTASGSGRTRI